VLPVEACVERGAVPAVGDLCRLCMSSVASGSCMNAVGCVLRAECRLCERQCCQIGELCENEWDVLSAVGLV
jgi:hypothetical protein